LAKTHAADIEVMTAISQVTCTVVQFVSHFINACCMHCCLLAD